MLHEVSGLALDIITREARDNVTSRMEKLELIMRLFSDSLSKARELSKIALDGKPELRAAAALIMKAVKATHQKIEALGEASGQNGKLDKVALDQALDRILKAAQQINEEVDNLLVKARG